MVWNTCSTRSSAQRWEPVWLEGILFRAEDVESAAPHRRSGANKSSLQGREQAVPHSKGKITYPLSTGVFLVHDQ